MNLMPTNINGCAEPSHTTNLCRFNQVLAWVCWVFLSLGCQPASLPPEIPPNQLDPELSSILSAARSNTINQPQSSDAWRHLGTAFDAAEFGAQAEICYTKALSIDPTCVGCRHLLAIRQLREHPEDAIENFTKASHLAGATNDSPSLRLAQALVERGRFTEATNSLSPILSRDPNHPAARLELSRALLALGQASALPSLLSPCLTNPYTARPSQWLLSQAWLRLGDADTAAKHARFASSLPKPFDWPDPFLREVQALRRDRTKISDQANALLQQRRTAEAENLIQQLLARVPDDPEGLLLLGRIRLQQRRCPEAESTLQRHLSLKPESLNGLIQLGMAYYCQSRWSNAAVEFEHAVALKPDFAQAHANLGLARSRLGDSKAAIHSFEQALRCNPGDANTHALLGEEWLRSGDLVRGQAHIKQALQLDPNHPKARAIMGRLK